MRNGHLEPGLDMREWLNCFWQLFECGDWKEKQQREGARGFIWKCWVSARSTGLWKMRNEKGILWWSANWEVGVSFFFNFYLTLTGSSWIALISSKKQLGGFSLKVTMSSFHLSSILLLKKATPIFCLILHSPTWRPLTRQYQPLRYQVNSKPTHQFVLSERPPSATCHWSVNNSYATTLHFHLAFLGRNLPIGDRVKRTVVCLLWTLAGWVQAVSICYLATCGQCFCHFTVI